MDAGAVLMVFSHDGEVVCDAVLALEADEALEPVRDVVQEDIQLVEDGLVRLVALELGAEGVPEGRRCVVEQVAGSRGRDGLAKVVGHKLRRSRDGASKLWDGVRVERVAGRERCRLRRWLAVESLCSGRS